VEEELARILKLSPEEKLDAGIAEFEETRKVKLK